ncbi:MAG: aminotransferase class I/II-fold pyridoxal phosphate-dependent enzyme [Planctomycetaceae bacterium]|nr:aminotransferase class I/II-fold pyridoxal phosphate-dependent enzyme [Planctomycetaceae bacterium]
MSALASGAVQARVRAVARYEPPARPQPVDLRLDSNEGAPPPAAWLARVVADCAGGVSRYANARALEDGLARRFGVDSAQIVVTAGADDALERVCRCLLGPGRALVLTTPTFEMMPRYAALAGAQVREVPWLDGPFPRAAFCAAVTVDTPLAYIASPNNPTGGAITRDDLRAVSEAAGDSTVVLLDLAYTEFADDDLMPLALELPNVIVACTLSKAWGLAGMRVGWAIAPQDLAGDLRRVGQPYAVSTLSLHVAARWLDDGAAFVAGRVERIRHERRALASCARELGGDPLESSANFVLVRLPKAPLVADLLAGCGIAVRRFPPSSPLADCLRITCPGDGAAFERLVAAFGSAMQPEAILFDMDGVLADVSGSYRRAIVETARTFGVTLTEADVAEAKSRPDSNNDWRVTRRLLVERGVDADIGEVTARFEAIYCGEAGTEPLWRCERSLIDRATLEALAACRPLGVVTGRPRRDAERFLAAHGLAGIFRTVVCMEDAPLKPDPAPLRLAMDRLGVGRAWYVGDTPDDVVAARAGGLVPIACVSPSDDAVVARQRLLGVGAAVVLSSVRELRELLA